MSSPPSDCGQYFAGLDKPFVRVHTSNCAVPDLDVFHGRLLMNFDAVLVSPASEPPGHGVVTGDGSRRMVQGSMYRGLVATDTQIDLGDCFLDELRSDDLAGDSQVFINLGSPSLRIQRRWRVCQSEVATFGIEQIQVEFPREVLKQLDAALVKVHALRCQIVGADNCRVSSGSTTTDVAFFENGDVRNTVVLSQVIRCRQTVPTPTNDDCVVLTLEFSRRVKHPWFGMFPAQGKL